MTGHSLGPVTWVPAETWLSRAHVRRLSVFEHRCVDGIARTLGTLRLDIKYRARKPSRWNKC